MSADKENKKASKPTKGVSDKSDALTRTERKTAKNKANMLAALSEHGGNVTRASKDAGITRKTHYEYLNDPDYAAAVDEVYEVGCDEAEQTIVDLMRNSNMDKVRLDAAKEILKARGKSRGYGIERRENKHEGEINTGGIVIQLPDNGRRTYSNDPTGS